MTTTITLDSTALRPATYASRLTDEQIRYEIAEARGRLAGQLDDGVRICVQARLGVMLDERNSRSTVHAPR